MAGVTPVSDSELSAVRERLLQSLASIQRRRERLEADHRELTEALERDEKRDTGSSNIEDPESFWRHIGVYFQPIGPEHLRLLQPEPTADPTPADLAPSASSSSFADLDPASLRRALIAETSSEPHGVLPDFLSLYGQLLASIVDLPSGPPPPAPHLSPLGPAGLVCTEAALLEQLRAHGCLPKGPVDFDAPPEDDRTALQRRLEAQRRTNNARRALLLARVERHQRQEGLRAAVAAADRDLERAYRKRKRRRSHPHLLQHLGRAVAHHEAALKAAVKEWGTEDLSPLWERPPDPRFATDPPL
jgi:hypothetical protein